MRVPLATSDFPDRAAQCYPLRIGVVDEPGPAQDGGPGSLTYGSFAARARGLAAGLDELEIAHGERVAIVSHNSTRLLESFFGVTRACLVSHDSQSTIDASTTPPR